MTLEKSISFRADALNDSTENKIIVDGKVVQKNLKELGLDDEWVQIQLRKQNINTVKEVLYAEIQGDGTLYIDKEEK